MLLGCSQLNLSFTSLVRSHQSQYVINDKNQRHYLVYLGCKLDVPQSSCIAVFSVSQCLAKLLLSVKLQLSFFGSREINDIFS